MVDWKQQEVQIWEIKLKQDVETKKRPSASAIFITTDAT